MGPSSLLILNCQSRRRLTASRYVHTVSSSHAHAQFKFKQPLLNSFAICYYTLQDRQHGIDYYTNGIKKTPHILAYNKNRRQFEPWDYGSPSKSSSPYHIGISPLVAQFPEGGLDLDLRLEYSRQSLLLLLLRLSPSGLSLIPPLSSSFRDLRFGTGSFGPYVRQPLDNRIGVLATCS